MQFDFRNKAVAFWKEQTQSPATRRQRVFDAVFGILVPAFCVFFDHWALAPIALFAYLEITIESIALGYYLLFCRSSRFLAGVLLAGALFSCLIAIVFLLFIPFLAVGFIYSLSQSQPDLALFSVFTLIFSLVPMATAFVFCRNTERCLKGRRILPSRTRQWLYVLPSVNVERLASSYKFSSDPNLRERLSSAYRSITGRSIEHPSEGVQLHPM